MAADAYNLVSSMRARYWEGRAEHRATPSGGKADAKLLNSQSSRSLLPGHPASEPEQLQLRAKNSTAACDATPHVRLPARALASANSREAAAVPGLGPAEPEQPLLRPKSSAAVPSGNPHAQLQASKLAPSSSRRAPLPSMSPAAPVPQPEQPLPQPKSSAGESFTTPHAQLPPRERAPSSGREAALSGLGPAEPVTPLRLHPASHRCMPTEQNTVVRQATTLSASQKRMPAEQITAAIGRQAPTLSAKGRGDLIASIVETGLQIATRMGDRAAAAALRMPEPARASPAAVLRMPEPARAASSFAGQSTTGRAPILTFTQELLTEYARGLTCLCQLCSVLP